jgi:DNA-binding MarR family transcriptional regulator
VVWRLAEGPLTQAVLAESMKVTPRNVTGLVDGLVETGFVTREPHPTDRRATLVEMKRGRKVVSDLQQGQVDLAKLLFGDLSDRQLAAFQKGMDHVPDVLREELSQ